MDFNQILAEKIMEQNQKKIKPLHVKITQATTEEEQNLKIKHFSPKFKSFE